MKRDKLDPFCRCDDRVSMAGVVTYCPKCRDRIAMWVIGILAGIVAIAAAVFWIAMK